jgi:hypothetical protein
VESSCKFGIVPSGSIKCLGLLSGLLSSAQRVSNLSIFCRCPLSSRTRDTTSKYNMRYNLCTCLYAREPRLLTVVASTAVEFLTGIRILIPNFVRIHKKHEFHN